MQLRLKAARAWVPIMSNNGLQMVLEAHSLERRRHDV